MAMYDNLLANVPTDLWIGGQWRKASDGSRFHVIDPATENKVASVANATGDDAKAAIEPRARPFRHGQRRSRASAARFCANPTN
jgi:succinate-semialdehyde dehydrogenase / glutarate-semialdehyde dehydrogenase